jgi:PIN domain nuclease of toxin-antitoxin system
MRLLIDTHAILWMVSDDPRLPARTRRMIVNADDLAWSIVSLWEMGIKTSLERRDFQLGPGWARLIPDELHRSGLRSISLASRHCDAVSRLPWHHRDPFDRILIATAQAENLALLSCDSRFDDYEVERHW